MESLASVPGTSSPISAVKYNACSASPALAQSIQNSCYFLKLLLGHNYCHFEGLLFHLDLSVMLAVQNKTLICVAFHVPFCDVGGAVLKD